MITLHFFFLALQLLPPSPFGRFKYDISEKLLERLAQSPGILPGSGTIRGLNESMPQVLSKAIRAVWPIDDRRRQGRAGQLTTVGTSNWVLGWDAYCAARMLQLCSGDAGPVIRDHGCMDGGI